MMEKVEAIVVSMKGEALLWYKWEHQITPLTAWKDLRNLILKYFRPQDEGNMYEQWFSI